MEHHMSSKKKIEEEEVDNPISASEMKLTFQVHFSAVTDYQRPFNWYKDKYDDDKKFERETSGFSEDFFEIDEKKPIYFGQSRCTVLLKGRTADTGDQVLLRVKGFKPWFYLYNTNSPHSRPSENAEKVKDLILLFMRKQVMSGKYRGDNELKNLSRYIIHRRVNHQKQGGGGGEYVYTCSLHRRQLLDGFLPNEDDGGATARTVDCYRIECPSKKARKIAISFFEREGELAALSEYCTEHTRSSSGVGVGAGVGEVEEATRVKKNKEELVSFHLCEHGSNIKALTQFRALTKITPMSWLTVNKDDCEKIYVYKEKYDEKEGGGGIGSCCCRPYQQQQAYNSKRSARGAALSYKAEYEVKCNLEKVILDVNNKAVSPFRVVSMDIESFSHDGAFPDPKDARNPVIVIGTRSYVYNAPGGVSVEKTIQAIQFVLGTTDREGYYSAAAAAAAASATQLAEEEEVVEQREFEVRNYETESSLLKGYRDYIVEEFDADAVLTWNGCGFDDMFLAERAIKTMRGGASSDFFKLGVLKDHLLRCDHKESTTNQGGDKDMYIWEEGTIGFAGRVFIDMMQQVKADTSTSYRSYALDFVANQMFGEHKIDLPYTKLFDNFLNGGPIGRFQNAEYCDRDCELPFRIEQRMQSVMSLMQMAAITNTEMFEILYKGQTRKAFNQIICGAHECNMIMNQDLSIVQPEGYEGAVVLDTKTGCYIVPLPVLDFASLYPSIMISEKLCYSTMVTRVDDIFIGDRGGPEQDAAIAELMRRYPNLKLNRKQIPNKDGSFLSPVFCENTPGLLPTILKNLLRGRSAAKKEMAAAYKTGDMIGTSIHNARQLALKVSANSVYGFTGAPTSQLPRLSIAATVTYHGRCDISMTKEFVCTNYTAHYIYVTVLGLEQVPENIIDMYEPIFKSRSPHVITTQVIGGDTDSVFVWFPVMPDKEGLRVAIKVAHHASHRCTEALFKAPMELEYEKTYFPSIFCVKKRYAAGKYVTGEETPEDIPIENEKKWRGFIECKGMETVRRDVPVFTSKLMINILYYILIQNNLPLAYRTLDNELTRLLEGRVTYEEMMITSQMQKEESYSNPDALAHVQVVRRMRERNPGSEYRVGDRVRFVYVRRTAEDHRRVLAQKKLRQEVSSSSANKKSKKIEMKQADFAEDMAYAKEKQMPLDIVYYFTRKLRKPIQKILIDTNPACKHMFDQWERKFNEKVTYGDSTANITDLLRARNAPIPASTSLTSLSSGEKRKHPPETQAPSSITGIGNHASGSLYIAKKQKLDNKSRAAAVEGKCRNINSMFGKR